MLGNLPHELVVSTVMVSATVIIHLLGLDLLTHVTGLHLRRLMSTRLHIDRLLVPLGIVMGLFILHGIEIWLYALAYRLGGILPTIEQALYFSISAYSTVGEAGPMLPEAWRVVGALEAINGMLLLGWSTAFLFGMLSHITEPADADHPLPRGVIARKNRARGPR